MSPILDLRLCDATVSKDPHLKEVALNHLPTYIHPHMQKHFLPNHP
jgi:hypothetical protein